MPREAWVLVKAMVSDVYPDIGGPGPQPPFPGGGGGGGPVDPGYSPPWARPQPPRPGWPTVPGWPGGSLPGGAGGFPHPDQGLPGGQPYPDIGLPPFPSHPIYIPITPPPDSGLSPEHPIYIPVYPDISPPGPQPQPGWPTVPGWPGGSLPGGPGGFPHPEHPIMAPGTPGWEQNAKIAFLQKAKKVIDFWTGNLPPKPDEGPEPTPVGQTPNT